MTTNRYPGTCCGCGHHVEAEAGFYSYGNVWCEEPTVVASAQGCSRMHRRAAEERVIEGEMQRAMNDRSYVPSHPKARERAEAMWARIDAENADPEVVARREANRQRLAAEDAAWAAQGLVRCQRCGGAGGHDSWPGWACYDCGGKGAVPHSHDEAA